MKTKPEKLRFYPVFMFCLLFVACDCDDKPDDPIDDGNRNGNATTTETLYREGITRISDDSLAFVLFAPGKTTVHLIVDFNDWTVSDDYRMTKDGDFFRLKTGRLDRNKEYVCHRNGIAVIMDMVLNHSYRQSPLVRTQQNADSSWNADVSWGAYKERGWETPNLVAYMESHDEERLMYKNNQYGKEYEVYSVKNLSTGLQRTAGDIVLYFTLPGPKMSWQFGELGYDYFLGASAEEGRLEMKPIRWDYCDDPERKALYDVFSRMIALKKENAALFNTSNFTCELQEPFKYVTLTSSNKNMVAMSNFDVVDAANNVNFGRARKWKDHFTNHEITISSPIENITLSPGEYRLYLND